LALNLPKKFGIILRKIYSMCDINYGLIVSDFDGTLVKDDGTIDERDKVAIAEYIRAGGIFAISTGRMPSGILSRTRELGLEGMVSCCQGAIILDIESGKFIMDGKIPYETTYTVVKIMEEMGLHIHIYDEWDFYSNKDDHALKMYEHILKAKGKLVLDRPLSQFVKENKFASYKILCMVEPKDNEDVLNALAAKHFKGCEVTKSSEYLVEVVNKNYSKGIAVEFLARRYHIPLKKTIAIGDQRNDLPMIKAAGLGVAVKNADAALKKSADFISAYTNEECAVSDIINRFGYMKEQDNER